MAVTGSGVRCPDFLPSPPSTLVAAFYSSIKFRPEYCNQIQDMTSCVFCDIISGSAPSDQLYADEELLVIQDIHPVAPVHVLVIPRKHIPSLNHLQPEDQALASRLLLTVPRIAHQLLGDDAAYRTIINTGAAAGQTVFHLHVHIISGRPFINHLLTRGLY